MYQIVKNGQLENYSIDASNEMNMGIKIVENFTIWKEVQVNQEIHMVMEGDPVVNIEHRFVSLHEGDVLIMDKASDYRYFSVGNAIIFTFKVN